MSQSEDEYFMSLALEQASKALIAKEVGLRFILFFQHSSCLHVLFLY
jgi:hypothetical protein